MWQLQTREPQLTDRQTDRQIKLLLNVSDQSEYRMASTSTLPSIATITTAWEFSCPQLFPSGVKLFPRNSNILQQWTVFEISKLWHSGICSLGCWDTRSIKDRVPLLLWQLSVFVDICFIKIPPDLQWPDVRDSKIFIVTINWGCLVWTMNLLLSPIRQLAMRQKINYSFVFIALKRKSKLQKAQPSVHGHSEYCVSSFICFIWSFWRR